jgi:hypothetical protein
MAAPLKPISNEYTPATGIVLRIYWIALGHAAALIITIDMVLSSLQRSPLLNMALALILISVIVMRYIDIRYCNGETADCKKATMSDWRAWSFKVVAAYLAVVIMVHLSVYL